MHSAEQTPKKFSAGDVIMRQGEHGEIAYIIESGKVEISIEQDDGRALNVGTRGDGAMIGEMSLIDNAPRTATVIAIEECELLPITKEDFSRRLQMADPVLRMTTQVILTRYRDTLMRAEIKQDKDSTPIVEHLEREYLDQADAVEKIRIANEFQKALGTDQVFLNYQPIVDLQSGEVYGFEALMRWIHPERGFISPGVFIPILEDNGQILEASKWGFHEACSALKRIQAKTGYQRELDMSINFSSEDFSSPDFIENIYTTLSETDVKAENIHLEITERLLMLQPSTARDALDMCRKAGMNISIDDFGTGYSSLSYLHAFPINTLKIDQSFVRDMHKNESSLELVRSIISLGQNLNMSVIAEGVEQIEEAQLLREMGCQYAQGFFFAKPMLENDVIDTVSSWDPDKV